MSDLIRISRRRLLASGGKATVIIAAGIAPKFIRPSRAYAADALSPGMIGGPTGFAGAERYQYGADTPEGRAIEAAKALKGAGKAPNKIVLGLSDGSIGQLTKPFPDGAPSIKDLWEKETGIPLEIVGLPNGQEFTKTMQDISTKGGAFDIYAVEWNRLGDLAETTASSRWTTSSRKHKPEWDDPGRGYVGGGKGVSLLNKYRGSIYGVSLDGDFQTWVYRKDLFEDAAEQKAFKGKYGYKRSARAEDLEATSTTSRLLPSAGQGSVRLDRSAQPGLGLHQLVSALCLDGSPNQFLFGDDGTPMINCEQGIAATNEYVASLALPLRRMRSPGAGRSSTATSAVRRAMTCAFSNLPKFLDCRQQGLPGHRQAAARCCRPAARSTAS